MTNEFYAVLIILISLSGTLLSFKLGANYLKAYIVMCYLAANILTVKIGNFFGLDMTPGTFLFSAIFLSTDMLAEKYGKKTALEAVYISFCAMIGFIIITQVNLMFTAVEFAQPASDALDTVFSASPRIFLASLTAYIVWQYVDVLIYERVHKKTGEKYLWLRNNISTLIGSFGSTFSFFFLAFYGTGADWIEMAIAGISIYWIIAILDTLIIYISKSIKPLDMK